MIADFYSRNKVIFDNKSRTPDRNERVNGLLRELTSTINASSAIPKTMDQIRTALKGLKKDAKAKVAHNEKSKFCSIVYSQVL